MKAVLTAVASLLALGAACAAHAQPTPATAARIRAIGPVVDPPSTALLYAPLAPAKPYEGVTVVRDVKYGPDARNILDSFRPAAASKGRRPMLIFVPGGVGDKIEAIPQGDHFYDNVMVWAVRNGMVGVNMQRHSMLLPWEPGARDVAMVIAWAKAHAAELGGDPDRIFLFGHSAGAATLANYLSHPQAWPAGGPGVKGAVLEGGPYDMAPLKGKAAPIQVRMGMSAKPFSPPPGDDKAVLAASVLPGMKALTLPLVVAVGGVEPAALIEDAETLNRELCKAGRCPTFLRFPQHGHMSEIFAVGSADTSTSDPILRWMRSVK